MFVRYLTMKIKFNQVNHVERHKTQGDVIIWAITLDMILVARVFQVGWFMSQRHIWCQMKAKIISNVNETLYTA